MSAPREIAGFGPRGVALLQQLLAIAFVVAWASLGVQIQVLAGSRGLLPAAELVRAIRERDDVSFLDFPTLFRLGASDPALTLGIAAGVVLALGALVGVLPRLCLGLSTALYLSYAVVCGSFLSFQWDNLLLECGALAVLLPSHRRAPWVVFLLRLALFKLYFESGLAKYQSHLGDWKDGSAMRFYYETAPIPTWVGWYAHRLPAWVHALESRGALGFELVVPLFVFLGRRGRLFASVVFLGFQTLNVLTANYGFFSYLALILQVVLLDDTDVRRAARLVSRAKGVRRVLRAQAACRLSARRRGRRLVAASRALRWTRTDQGRTLVFLGRLGLATAVSIAYVGVSLDGALETFAGGAFRSETMSGLAETLAKVRLVNTYHLFGHITRERIEPVFETSDGSRFTEHDLRYKPGNPRRPPPFVAPHQPRVDFLLWFYGLSYERMPGYVRNLLARICHDPDAVSPLFAGDLPPHPVAARVRFYRYHFTATEERAKTGAWWTREPLDGDRTLDCAR